MKNEEQETYDAVALWFTNEKDCCGDDCCTELTLNEELEFLEKSRIKNALDCNDGNRSHAAKQLGIGRTLLIHKIKKYQLNG